MKTIKKIFVSTLFVLTILAQLSFTKAGLVEKPNQKKLPELTCIGEDDGRPFFRLCLANEGERYYTLTIFSGKRDIIFEEKLEGKNILRIYKLDADDYNEISKTTFELTDNSNNEKTVYAIKSETKNMQNMIIAKL